MKKIFSILIGLVTILFGIYPATSALAKSESESESSITTSVNENGSGDELEVKVGVNNQEESSHDATTTKLRGDDSERNSEKDASDTEDTEIEVDHEHALTATSTVEDSGQVHNRGELRSYLNHLMKQDEHISAVNVSSTTVDTQYSLPANFLGAIPAHVQAQVTVGADGAVTITYPWYAFLFAKHDDKLKSALTQVSSELSASTTLSASAQAHFLNAIFTILKGE